MNRIEFQQLAEERLADANALLRAQRYSAAYYLAGYAVECGFKSHICKKIKAEEFPPRNAKEYYVHALTTLVSLAGLDLSLANEIRRLPSFKLSWSSVKDWKEDARYELRTRAQAEEIISAIVNPDDGVMQWLKRDW